MADEELNDLDLSMPFEPGMAKGGAQVTEQDVPLPHSFRFEWLKS